MFENNSVVDLQGLVLGCIYFLLLLHHYDTNVISYHI